jgi:penicillin-binding protein 1A
MSALFRLFRRTGKPSGKERQQPSKRKGGTAGIMKRPLIVIFILAIVLPTLIAGGSYLYFSQRLPKFTSLKDYQPATVTQVFSRDGQVIAEYFIERRYVVPLSQVPPATIQAFVAAEDANFFEHRGLDYPAILRAAFKNIESMEIVQGGSTITQQITKSLLLSPEKSFARKIKEAILAQRIERYLTKSEILEIYLNQIYLGEGAYGIEAAARTYFGKGAPELSLAEGAVLAGLPKAPSLYSPVRHPERARKRQVYVLDRMVERGYASSDEAEDAKKAPLTFVRPEKVTLKTAPYFSEHIRKILEKRYGSESLYRDGLKVWTTVDLAMQATAQESLSQGLKNFEERRRQGEGEPPIQGALVCLDPNAGAILSLVGGRDFQGSQFNRAIQARRQPGSAFKPIVYAAALDKGYTPVTTILDSPLVLFMKAEGAAKEFWEPNNYDEQFRGRITFRKALTQSRNVATVKILRDIGIDYVINYAQRLGIASPLNRDLSLALGSSGMSLLELVSAYSVFAAGGVRAEPVFIAKILDRNDEILEENRPRLIQAISPQTAYLMTSLLQSVVEEGTGRRVRALGRPCAGKTGTTNEVRDAWFIGFTPDLIAGVWVGFDDETPLGKHETGAVAASPIWLTFMQEALRRSSMKVFTSPEGIIFMKVDPETGGPPSAETRDSVFESFKEGTIPTGIGLTG